MSETAEHEALCRRCGQSCHFAVPVNGLPVVVDDLHCRFLAREPDGTFTCTVYAERFERAPWCQTVDQALAGGFLARDCPYARGVSGVRGKTRLSPRLMRAAEPAIRAHLLEYGAPFGASEAGIQRFMARTGGGRFRVVAEVAGEWLRVVAEAPPEPEG